MDNKPNLNTWTIGLIWLGLLGITTFIFNGVLDDIQNPNQQLTMNDGELVLERNKYGHYIASGEINGKSVEFLLDTGATLVAIPEHIANRLKLKKGRTFQSETANGLSLSYETRIDRLTLGDIVMHNVPASISSGMTFDQILLGMSFLKYLRMVQQGNKLTLSVPE